MVFLYSNKSLPFYLYTEQRRSTNFLNTWIYQKTNFGLYLQLQKAKHTFDSFCLELGHNILDILLFRVFDPALFNLDNPDEVSIRVSYVSVSCFSVWSNLVLVTQLIPKLLSVPKCSANLYCICLSLPQIHTEADAVQICGKFWDTQYYKSIFKTLLKMYIDQSYMKNLNFLLLYFRRANYGIF